MEEKVKKNKKIKKIVFVVLFMLITFFLNNRIDIGIMQTRGIEAFNNQWINYEGTQSGAQVKSLLAKTMAGANTWRDEPEKILNVEFFENKYANIVISGGENSIEEYISKIKEIYDKIASKKMYTVSVKYSKITGLVNEIIIEDNKYSKEQNQESIVGKLELENEALKLKNEELKLKNKDLNNDLKLKNNDLEQKSNDLKAMLVLLSITVVILIIVLIKNRRKNEKK